MNDHNYDGSYVVTPAPSENEHREHSWGKGGQCVQLTTSPTSRAECHEIWEPKPPGTLWATPGLLRDSYAVTSLPDWSLGNFRYVISVSHSIATFNLLHTIHESRSCYAVVITNSLPQGLYHCCNNSASQPLTVYSVHAATFQQLH
jgi:hypothetical protein